MSRRNHCSAAGRAGGQSVEVGRMGQILFSPGLRMMRSGPQTEKQDHECNAKQAGQENSSRLQIEPVLSNGPEQDNPDQKGQDIGHCCWVSSITVHLIVSLSTPEGSRRSRWPFSARARYRQEAFFLAYGWEAGPGCYIGRCSSSKDLQMEIYAYPCRRSREFQPVSP